MKYFKTLFSLLIISFSSHTFAVDSNMKISAKIVSGCVMSANDVHFNLNKDHVTAPTKWSNLTTKTFDAVEFMFLRVQCSKGTKFGVQASSSQYGTDQREFLLRHTSNANAPTIKYWVNNYSPNSSELSNMLSSNLTRNVSVNLYTRLTNGIDRLSYTINDGNEGWIKFAVQLEAESYYNFVPGNYSDTLNIQITY